MPRQGQIIPDYLHPHVATYINDNTIFEDEANTAPDDSTRLISVIASSKGRDRQVMTFDNIAEALEEFGVPNYGLHGQPIYNMYAALRSGFAKVHVMRIMPDDATYANAVILAKVKPEGGSLKVKYESVKIDNFTDKNSIAVTMKSLTQAYPEVDSQGYSTYPIMGFVSQGRGVYGNNFRVRIVSDLQLDEDNQYKNYRLNVMSAERNLIQKESHAGTFNEMAIIGRESLFFDDIVNDPVKGSTRIESYIDTNNLQEIYKLWLAQKPETENIVPWNEFDFLYGKNKALKALEKYTIEDGSFAFDSIAGIILAGGDDGEFSTTLPTPKKTVANFDAAKALTVLTDGMKVGDLVLTKDDNTWYKLIDADKIATDEGWQKVVFDRAASLDKEYIKAFSGKGGYDNALQSKRRTPAELILDANYSNDVKRELAKLALKRYDARLVLDAGIVSSSTQVLGWADEFKNITDRIISKECQHYQIADPYTNKRIPMTVTYFFASFLPPHYRTFGNYIPFVGEGYAKIAGHVKNSLKPIIDADDLSVKEEIYKARINYFECIAENNYVRGTQGTSQNYWSDLSEENNVAVVLEMKRMLENFVAKKIYNFAEPEDRKKFTEDAERMFSDYPNRKCRSFSVRFDMNKWEEERSILHCYLEVVFRTLAKRGIIEIDINKRV